MPGFFCTIMCFLRLNVLKEIEFVHHKRELRVLGFREHRRDVRLVSAQPVGPFGYVGVCG